MDKSFYLFPAVIEDIAIEIKLVNIGGVIECLIKKCPS